TSIHLNLNFVTSFEWETWLNPVKTTVPKAFLWMLAKRLLTSGHIKALFSPNMSHKKLCLSTKSTSSRLGSYGGLILSPVANNKTFDISYKSIVCERPSL